MEEGEILTINNSRYFLLEFPPDIVPEYTVNVLYSLKVMGYKPIIVHPERYEPVQANPDLLYYWIEDGFLAQVNASSLLGVFGSDVEKIAVKLVKNNLVQFIGSDLHGTGRRDQCLGRGLNKLKRLTGPYAEQYLENAAAVINDEELNFMDPEKIKQSWFMGKIRSLLM